ncbi:MAG: ABC transporter substrate-binding protein [Desulfobacterales bacterium]
MHRRHRIRPLAILIFSIVAITLAGALPASAAKTYKIGGVFSITGPASFLGDPEKRSMEMAVDAINAAGGIDGRQVEAVIYDTEGDPTKAVNAVNKLIYKDRVIAIVGPSLTPTSLAVIPLAEKAGIPLISCAAGIQITQPVKPMVFKTAQSDVLAVAAIYRYMKTRNIRRIGLLSVADAFGESGAEQVKSQAAGSGIEVVRAESFGAKDTDMTAQLTKIRSDNPDAIVCWGTNPGPAVVAKNRLQLKMDLPLYQSHGVASAKFIELAGEAAEGLLLPAGKILVHDLLPEGDPQKAVLAGYVKDYEARFSTPVSGFGGYAYDGVHLLKLALPGTDGNPKAIRDNLENIKGYVGVSGVFNFSSEEHNGLGPDAFVMVSILNGGWTLAE